MRLILVRHGETSLNSQGRAQGQNDAPLSERGREQVAAVAHALAKETPFSLYSSPLARAKETAQIIANQVQVPVVPIEGLKEVNLGELDGLTPQEWREKHPEFTARWEDNAASVKIPGGESIAQVQRRTWRSVSKILEESHPTAVIVSHRFAIGTILCRALGIPLRNFRSFPINLGSITVLQVGDKRNALLSFNNFSHLSHSS